MTNLPVVNRWMRWLINNIHDEVFLWRVFGVVENTQRISVFFEAMHKANRYYSVVRKRR